MGEMNKWLSLGIRGCAGKITRISILIGIVFLFLFVSSGMFFLLPSLRQKIVNPWSEHGYTFCSKRYDICVMNEPKWSVMIAPPNFFRKDNLVISFFVMNFNPAHETPDLEAEVSVPYPEKLRTENNYEIANSMDLMQLLLQKLRVSANDFHIVEQPASGRMNGREFSSIRYAIMDNKKDVYESKMFVFVADRKAYSVFYRAKKNLFEQYQPEAMKIIESFQFGRGREVKK